MYILVPRLQHQGNLEQATCPMWTETWLNLIHVACHFGIRFIEEVLSRSYPAQGQGYTDSINEVLVRKTKHREEFRC